MINIYRRRFLQKSIDTKGSLTATSGGVKIYSKFKMFLGLQGGGAH